jgi:hypothetical protein
MKNKKFRPLWVFIFGILFLSSCRYQAGYPGEDDGRSISIRVENRSLAGQLGPILNRSVKDEILRIGVHHLVTETENAHSRVKITIQDYQKSAQAYNSNDSLLASGFELSVQAKVEISKTKYNHRSKVFTLFSRGHVMRLSSLEQPKDRQALADIARDLGSRIAQRLAYQTLN